MEFNKNKIKKIGVYVRIRIRIAFKVRKHVRSLPRMERLTEEDRDKMELLWNLIKIK